MWRVSATGHGQTRADEGDGAGPDGWPAPVQEAPGAEYSQGHSRARNDLAKIESLKGREGAEPGAGLRLRQKTELEGQELDRGARAEAEMEAAPRAGHEMDEDDAKLMRELEIEADARIMRRIGEGLDARIMRRIDEGLDARLDARIMRRIGEGLDARLDARERRRMDGEAERDLKRWLKWYREVGIHRDFARDYAKYMARVSC